jgi:hypothetical protein
MTTQVNKDQGSAKTWRNRRFSYSQLSHKRDNLEGAWTDVSSEDGSLHPEDGEMVAQHYQLAKDSCYPQQYPRCERWKASEPSLGVQGYLSAPSVLKTAISCQQGRCVQNNARSLGLITNSELCSLQLADALVIYCKTEHERDKAPVVDADLHIIGKSGVEVKTRDDILKALFVDMHKECSVELRHYSDLEKKVAWLEVPDDLTIEGALRRLQCFSAARTDVDRWLKRRPHVAVIPFIIKCLTALGYWAPSKTIRDNPARVLANIYHMFDLEPDGDDRYDLSKTLSSTTSDGGIEKTIYQERRDDEIEITERWSRTEDISTLCDCGRTRVTTCANLTSIGLVFNGDQVCRSRHYFGYATLPRACYLLFRAKENYYKYIRKLAEACIKCIWGNVIKLGVRWAVWEAESLLSLPHLTLCTLDDRMRACEKRMGFREFRDLQPCLPMKEYFGKVETIIAALQFISDYELGKEEFSIVHRDREARICYAVACLSILGYSPPKDWSHKLVDEYSKIIWEVDRRAQQAAPKARK